MSDIDEQQINATLTELNRVLMSEGALMRFSPASGSTEPLQKALIKVFDIYFKHKTDRESEENKRSIENSKEAENIAKRVAENQLDGIKKFLSKEKSKEQMTNEESWSNLSSYLDDLKKSDDEKKKILAQSLGQLMGSYKVAKEIFGVVKNIGTAVYGLAKDRIEMLASLRESGVSLRDGFDKSFHELAVESGKSREQLAEFFKKNSKFIAQLNASGINGAQTISGAARQLRYSVGLTRKEIDGTIEYFGNIMHNVWNDAKLNSIDFNNEILSTAKMLKQLAVATGQSTDQIIAHAKEQAKTWQMERIRTNPRFAAQYAAMKAGGADDELIEGILLGKTNKAVLQASLAPGGTRAIAGLRNWARSTRGMSQEDVAKAYMDLVNGSSFAGFRNQEKWVSENMEKFAWWSQNAEVIASSSRLIGRNNVKLDKNGAVASIDTNNPETKAIEAYSKFNESLNNLHTTLRDAISPGLEASAGFLNILNGPLSDIAGIFKSSPVFTASMYWLWEIGNGVGKAFLNVVTPVMMMNYLSGGKIFGEHVTEVLTKGLTKTFKLGAGMLSKSVQLIAGAGVGAIMAANTGDSALGSMAGGAIGGALGTAAGKWGGAKIGAMIGTAIAPGIGTAIGGALGFIGGSLLGSYAGGKIGNVISGSNENDPAKVDSPSSNNDYLSPTDNLQPVSVQSAHHTISVSGMEALRRTLKNIDENTKMMYTELRNRPKVGTNLATG